MAYRFVGHLYIDEKRHYGDRVQIPAAASAAKMEQDPKWIPGVHQRCKQKIMQIKQKQRIKNISLCMNNLCNGFQRMNCPIVPNPMKLNCRAPCYIQVAERSVITDPSFF